MKLRSFPREQEAQVLVDFYAAKTSAIEQPGFGGGACAVSRRALPFISGLIAERVACGSATQLLNHINRMPRLVGLTLPLLEALAPVNRLWLRRQHSSEVCRRHAEFARTRLAQLTASFTRRAAR